MNPAARNRNESTVRPSLLYLSLAQLQRYGLAVLVVAVGVGAIELFEKFGFRPATGMLMMTVVALNSWYQRRGPALLSLILALLAMNYFFVGPRHSFNITISELPYYLIFTSCAKDMKKAYTFQILMVLFAELLLGFSQKVGVTTP